MNETADITRQSENRKVTRSRNNKGSQLAFNQTLQYKPGPGQYEPSTSLSKSRVKTATLRGSERFTQTMRSEIDKPGPGHYHQELYFARNASPITIKGKSPHRLPNDLPGPGAYNASYDLVKHAIANI